MMREPYPAVMEYGVSVDLRLPDALPRLDPLQAEGAVSVLDRLLGPVGVFRGAGGDEVVIEGRRVASHPDGALVLLVIEATSLEAAETGARDIMLEVLQRSELLAGWQVVRCEVGFDERFAEAGLRAADGPGLPPADVVERARWHEEQRQRAPRPIDPGDEIGWRDWFAGQASLVRAFGPEAFGVDDGSARLAAGALVAASSIVIDELFEDIKTLAGGTVADSDSLFFVLDDLPKAFAIHYNGRFARSFLVATVMVTGRFSAEQWSPPTSVAEALALRLVVEQARYLLAEHQVVDQKEAQNLYREFEDAAFEDTDHEWLYQGGSSGSDFGRIHGSGVESWFEQTTNSASGVHPFTIDSEPSEGSTTPNPKN